jgi:hypothetical protein
MERSVKRGRVGLLGIVILALSAMGSDGTCVNMTGPYSSGYPQAGYPASQTQTFYAPTVGGKRVDWCLHWRTQCGEPAATAFCQRKGYDRAIGWTIAKNIGAHTPTLVLGDGAVCGQPGCDGFDRVTCGRGGGPGAPPGPQAGPPQVNFTFEPNTDRPGKDYKRVVLQAPNAKHCKNLCRQDSHCKAYTYVPPGVQMPGNAVCWLKKSVPHPVAANGFVSGVKH